MGSTHQTMTSGGEHMEELGRAVRDELRSDVIKVHCAHL